MAGGKDLDKVVFDLYHSQNTLNINYKVKSGKGEENGTLGYPYFAARNKLTNLLSKLENVEVQVRSENRYIPRGARQLTKLELEQFAPIAEGKLKKRS